MNGGFSQQARALAAAMADGAPAPSPTPIVTIDDNSEPGAWETAYAHSPAIYCSCCGNPARDCLIVHPTIDDGAFGLGDYPPEMLLS